MRRIVSDEALDTLFRSARSHYAWLPQPVGDTLLRALWELMKRGPSSGLMRPLPVIFATSQEAKACLALALPEPLRDSLRTAPAAAILGCAPAGERPAVVAREGGLSAATLILAARALGLDCGPFWEFDRDMVDSAFFSDGSAAAIFVCAIGYADQMQASGAETRSDPDAACRIL